MHPLRVPQLLLFLLFLLCAPASVFSQQTTSRPPVTLSGYIQAREVYQQNIGLTGSINRARLAASGTVITAVSWRMQGEFRTSSVGTGRASVSLQDAYLRYAPGSWAVQAGQFKTPFTREFITTLADLETADRSTVVDSIAPKRDIGVMGEYSRGVLGLWAGVFNGEGQNVTANTDSTVLAVARVVVHVQSKVALGLNGARYFGDSTRYGVDAAYDDRRIGLRGEYIGQTRDTRAGPDDWGWYGLGSLFVVPTLQAVFKYEDFGRPSLTAAVRNRAWTTGVNWFPSGKNFRLTFDYLSRKTGVPGVRKGRLLGQVQAKF